MSDELAGLAPAQRAAAEALEGPVLIKAGPGSGKTRTITHRIAHGVRSGHFEESRTLAVTFTARAAAELHSRLAALGASGVAVRTFHSAALRQLRHFWPDVIGGGAPRIETDRAALLNQAAGRRLDAETSAELLTELDWMKARGLTAADYRGAGRVTRQDPAVVADLLGRYELAKSERGVMDFDDVLLVTVGLLDTRSDMREAVRRAFRWFTVDEYQDVSPLQQRLLDLWVGERRQLCVVGDPAQTIYQFAGADPSLLATFPARYPGATVVELPDTYRCAATIAAAANRLAEHIPGALRLRTVGDATGTTRLLQFPSEADEAAGVAAEVADLVAGGHPDVAILYRTHAQGRVLHDHLRRREIPFSTRGADRFFDRAEVKEACTRFRGAARMTPTEPAADVMAEVLLAMSYDPAPPDAPAARQRWESLAALAALFPPEVSAADGQTELDRRATDNEPPRPAGVALLTLHAAKGLEWDTVFIIGAVDGQLPSARAATPEARDEERRLMYVGVTRPRRRLIVTWPTANRSGPTTPSPYLTALGSGEAGAAPPPLAAPGVPAAEAVRGLAPARCRLCGRALVTGQERVLGRCYRCALPADETLLAALFAWRDRRAQEMGVPGHLVLTDVTLHAIAEQRPQTEEELAAIPGMRPDRMRDHGAVLLDLVRPPHPRP